MIIIFHDHTHQLFGKVLRIKIYEILHFSVCGITIHAISSLGRMTLHRQERGTWKYLYTQEGFNDEETKSCSNREWQIKSFQNNSVFSEIFPVPKESFFIYDFNCFSCLIAARSHVAELISVQLILFPEATCRHLGLHVGRCYEISALNCDTVSVLHLLLFIQRRIKKINFDLWFSELFLLAWLKKVFSTFCVWMKH